MNSRAWQLLDPEDQDRMPGPSHQCRTTSIHKPFPVVALVGGEEKVEMISLMAKNGKQDGEEADVVKSDSAST